MDGREATCLWEIDECATADDWRAFVRNMGLPPEAAGFGEAALAPGGEASLRVAYAWPESVPFDFMASAIVVVAERAGRGLYVPADRLTAEATDAATLADVLRRRPECGPIDVWTTREVASWLAGGAGE